MFDKFQGVRHARVEDSYQIGGWRWQLLESVKALHTIDDPREDIFKLILIRDLKASTSDNDTVVAVKRYRYAIKNHRSPENFDFSQSIAA